MHQTLRFVYNINESVFTLVLKHVMSHTPIPLLLIGCTFLFFKGTGLGKPTYCNGLREIPVVCVIKFPPCTQASSYSRKYFIAGNTGRISEIQNSLESLDCVL